MNKQCPRENEVRRATKKGEVPPELRPHLDSCAACRQIFQVSRWLQEFSDATRASVNVPDYGLIWLKAQFIEKQKNERKVMRPMLLFECLAGFIAGAVLFTMLFINPSGLQNLFANLKYGATISQLFSGPVLTLSAVALGFLFLIATFLITASSFARDD